MISGVTVAPSPDWMAARLRAVGLRPISNVVDVTNYVLWERGHPLHAFDRERVADGSIVVRRARAGERFTTLDGQERVLTDAMLVIADPVKAIGLAGVMGGAVSEVSGATTCVLLESAYFTPASIRRTSRALGLHTDAAHRFERGADIEELVEASARAAQLIAELAGGAIARGLVDAYPAPRPAAARAAAHGARRARARGGATPAGGRADPDIARTARRDRGADVEVEVPSFRRDLAMEDDLVEEVIRVWGYDRIPSAPPTGAIHLVTQPDAFRQEHAVREALAAAGLTEVVTYSFSDPAHAAVLPGIGPEESLSLLNPLSQEASAHAAPSAGGHSLRGGAQSAPAAVRREPVRAGPHLRARPRRHPRTALGRGRPHRGAAPPRLVGAPGRASTCTMPRDMPSTCSRRWACARAKFARSPCPGWSPTPPAL